MADEHAGYMVAAGVFAVGAVAIILYHHADATNQIVAGVRGLTGVKVGSQPPAVQVPAALQSASLAGTPTPGQGSRGAWQNTVVPMYIGPGYQINTQAGLN